MYLCKKIWIPVGFVCVLSVLLGCAPDGRWIAGASARDGAGVPLHPGGDHSSIDRGCRPEECGASGFTDGARHTVRALSAMIPSGMEFLALMWPRSSATQGAK